MTGCLETFYRIEFGARYYTLASAAGLMTIIASVYGVMAGLSSALVYLVILSYRRLVGRPRERAHVSYWSATLILAGTGHLLILLIANKWFFTDFELFSKLGLLSSAALSAAYWIGVFLLLKLLTPRLIRRQPGFGFRARVVMLAAMILTMGAVFVQTVIDVSAGKSGTPSNKTNLILISIDTLRRDRVGCFGSGMDTSPHLDRLREESVIFPNAYCEIPITNPSHVSMITGLSIASHGNHNNGDRLDKNTLTLASIMKKKGYRTAAFVSALPLCDRLSNLSMGFEIYDDNLRVPAWIGDSFVLEAASLLYKIARGTNAALSIPAGEVVDRTTNWIDGHAYQPFFLFVHLFDPHLPYEPPPDFREKYTPASESEHDINNARYNGEVRYCDSEIGRLMDHLESMGLLSRSLLVVVADHGEELGEDEQDFYGHGYYLWEEVIQVPMMMRLPDGRLAGSSRSDFCQLVDLTPTILPLLGLSAPEGTVFDGRDLLAENLADRPLFIQAAPIQNTVRLAVLNPPWKLIHLYERTGDTYRLQREWLFNIEDDIFETMDLSDRGPVEVVSRLQSGLDIYTDGALSRREDRQDRLSREDISRLRALGYLR